MKFLKYTMIIISLLGGVASIGNMIYEGSIFNSNLATLSNAILFFIVAIYLEEILNLIKTKQTN